MAPEAVLTECLSVAARNDDECLVKPAGIFNSVEQSFDVFVRPLDGDSVRVSDLLG